MILLPIPTQAEQDIRDLDDRILSRRGRTPLRSHNGQRERSLLGTASGASAAVL